MFRRKSLFTVAVLVTGMFCGCVDEDKHEYSFEIEIPDPNVYAETVKDVNVKITPKTVVVGGKILLDAIHEDGDVVDVVIFSESLAYRDTIATPYRGKMSMNVVGVHDISFEVDGEEVKIPAAITVIE
ncbi:MAG: hypothetical protein IKK87_06345 [Bacteroidaceae bacterium]|nr:hypothetical protein [Bacteroidaceae bacterium]